MATSVPGLPKPRVNLSLFAIPLGFAGLGGAWSAAIAVVGAPEWVSDVLFSVSALLWLVFVALYVVERIPYRGAFRFDRENPSGGAAAAFLPVIGILLVAHFEQYTSAATAQALSWCFIAALAVVSAQLFAHWLTGNLDFEALNPGYFLPLVAGSFIASIGLSGLHAVTPARAALGVGLFFWLVIGSVVTARLIGRGALPQAAIPSLSLLMAPPAVGGIATFATFPGAPGMLQQSFLGVFLVMVLIQVCLVRTYRRLSFALGFWNFTFPAAVGGNYAVRWFGTGTYDGHKELAWAALSLVTAILLAVGATTVRDLVRARRTRPGAEGGPYGD